jgi:hypothetical protein
VSIAENRHYNIDPRLPGFLIPQIISVCPLGTASDFVTVPDFIQQVPPLSPVHEKWVQSAQK